MKKNTNLKKMISWMNNEHEGKIYEEKNAKMFGCVMWIQRIKETQEKSFKETIQLLKMWQNV